MLVLQYKNGTGTPIVTEGRTLLASSGGLWVNDNWSSIFADPAGSSVDTPWSASSGMFTNLKGTTIVRSSSSLYVTTDLENFTEVDGLANGHSTTKPYIICWSEFHNKWFWMSAHTSGQEIMHLSSSEDGVTWTTVFTGKVSGFDYGDPDRLAVDDNGVMAFTHYTFATPANPVMYSIDGGTTWQSSAFTFSTTLAQRIEHMGFIEGTWWAWGQYSRIWQSTGETPAGTWSLVHQGGGQFDEALQLVYGNGEIFKTENDSGSNFLSVAAKTGPGTWGAWSDRVSFYSSGPYSMGFDPRNNEFCFASGTTVASSTTNWNSQTVQVGSWGGMICALYTRVVV